MKNISKGKEFSKQIRVVSVAVLLLSAVSFKAYSQNYPGQPPGQIPTQQPGYPNPNAPTNNPSNPTTNPTTTPPAPNLNLPSSPQLKQDTMHLYNPVKPDTGHLKLQINVITSFNSTNQTTTAKRASENVLMGYVSKKELYQVS